MRGKRTHRMVRKSFSVAEAQGQRQNSNVWTRGLKGWWIIKNGSLLVSKLRLCLGFYLGGNKDSLKDSKAGKSHNQICNSEKSPTPYFSMRPLLASWVEQFAAVQAIPGVVGRLMSLQCPNSWSLWICYIIWQRGFCTTGPESGEVIPDYLGWVDLI